MPTTDIPPFADGQTVIEDYAEIQEVLKSPAFRMMRGDEPVIARAQTHGLLAAIDGDEHLHRRRVESKLFTNDALQYLEGHALKPIIENVLQGLRARRSDDGIVRTDLKDLILRLLHQVAAAVTGVDGVESPEQIERFTALVGQMNDAVALEWFKGGHDDIVQRAIAAQQSFDEEFCQSSLARRRALIERARAGDLDADALPRDLFTLMLLNWQDGWDADLAVREAALFANASTRTTARTACHVVDNVASWLHDHPEDATKTRDSLFIRSAAAESLRLHVVLPALLRRASEHVVLSSGRVVDEGEAVVLMFNRANRDPRTFGPDADVFDPYRQQRLDPRILPWGISFGGGAHMCIGRRMVTGGDWFAKKGPQRDRDLDGTLTTLLLRLYEHGIEPDPEDPPVPVESSYYDDFIRYPVRFAHL